MPKDDILKKMEQLLPQLSKRRRTACQYILEHPLNAGNMSLSELAAQCGTGSATIMRLVTEDLELESFILFKKLIRNAYVHRQESNYGIYQKRQMQTLQSEKPKLAHPSTALLDSIPEYLQSIQTPEFWLQMEQAVQLLIQAERIFVIGLRSAIGAATVFESEIRQLTGNVFQLSNTQEMIFDRAMEMTPQDILVVFSNWPYTKRTIDVANFASARGIPFILETNLSDHPLRDQAAAVLNSNSVNLPYHILPSILVVELLVYELRCHVQPKVDKQLPETERLLDSLKIEIFEHQRQR